MKFALLITHCATGTAVRFVLDAPDEETAEACLAAVADVLEEHISGQVVVLGEVPCRESER